MKKNIIKTIFISFLLFFSIAFINVDGVRAEDDGSSGSCTCYYAGENDISSGGYDGQVATNKQGYLASIRFVGDKYKLVSSCYNNYTQGDNGAIVYGQSFKQCKSKDFGIGSPFSVDAKYISGNNCSVDACNSTRLYLDSKNSTPYITTKSGPIQFSAISSDSFNSTINQDTEMAKEHGDVADTDIDSQAIINWGNNDKIETVEPGTASCDLIPDSIMQFLKNLFLVIQVIGIVLLIVLSAIELIKAIIGADDDGLKGAIKNTFRRIIVVIILLILPAIIIWALNMINNNAYETDNNGKRVIGENGNPLCK